MQAHIRCLEILNKSVKNQANGKVGKVEQWMNLGKLNKGMKMS
jgi:hypothetical protein